MDSVSKKYKKAASDSDLIDSDFEKRPALKNLLNILYAMTGEEVEDIATRFTGLGFSSLKKEIIEAHEHYLLPISKKYNTYLDSDVHAILSEGQSIANSVSEKH